ncbi:MAG: hypothetical protein SHS37scaffold145_58 [Phage 71_18]|nr:MAG: hypothetical protein SHS37scaffold145_58 [Phage 71_18]
MSWTYDDWMAARCISVRQPWAWAISLAADDPDAKLVENRGAGFPASYRGLVFVHAGLQLSVRGNTDPRILNLADDHPVADVRGAVICVAELADVHHDTGCCRPWGESQYVTSSGTLQAGVAHLVLEDVQRLAEPVPTRGYLGLWRARPELVNAVRAQAPA